MTISIPNAKVRTRPTWLIPLLLVWGPLGLAVTLYTLGLALWGTPIFFAVPVVYFAGLFALAGALRLWLIHHTGELRADETGLTLAGKPFVARTTLSYGHVVRCEGEPLLLRLVPRAKTAHPIDVEVADEAQANELLAAMYLDRTVAEYLMSAGHAREQLWMAVPMMLVGVGGFLALMVKLTLAFAPLLHGDRVVVPVFFALLILAGCIVVTVTSLVHFAVGLDGVWLRRRFVEKRFIPFSQILSIEETGRDLTLKLTDCTTIQAHYEKLQVGDAASFVARVRAGIAATPNASSMRPAAHAVARNGRSIAEWIANAARTSERSATYRAPIVPHDDLWRIVEDAAASPIARAGAALALRADLGAEGRARLRVAADTCAENKLRVALESVATSDDEALAAALEPLEEPLAQRRLRNRDHH